MRSHVATIETAAGSTAGTRELLHVALDGQEGERLDEASLSDRQKLAVVFLLFLECHTLEGRLSRHKPLPALARAVD